MERYHRNGGDWIDLLQALRVLGGPGSGDYGHAGRPGEVGGSAPDHNGHVERARVAHRPCLADKQRAAEANEDVLVNGLGGDTYQTGDNAPIDVVTTIGGEEHGIEVKTMVDQVNDKITMSKDAIQRKHTWVKEHEPAALHTVVFDTRYGHTAIYYHRGVGSFRLSTFIAVTSWGHLRRLMRNDMSYYLADGSGYISDVATNSGLRSFRKWALGTGSEPVSRFLSEGETLDPVALADSLEAMRAPNPDDEDVRFTLERAARQAQDILILSDGTGSGEDLKTLGGPGSGNFGHAGRPGEVGGSAPNRQGFLTKVKLYKPSASYSKHDPNGLETRNQYKDPLTGRYTADRQLLHDAIVARIFEGLKRSEHPEAIFMGGGPASGNSTMANAEAIGSNDHAHIDVDEIRQQLPEFSEYVAAGRIKEASAFTHEEASEIANQARAYAASHGISIVMDGTGDSSVEKLAAKLEQMRAAGFTMVGRYATLPTDTAWFLAQERAKKPPFRAVEEHVVRNTHKAVSITLPAAMRARLFDDVELYDTRNRDAARLVASADRSGNITIFDQGLWDEFLRKALG